MLRMQEHSCSWPLPATAGSLLRAASEGVAGSEGHDRHSHHIFGGVPGDKQVQLSQPACKLGQ